jgi:hypothetical protein
MFLMFNKIILWSVLSLFVSCSIYRVDFLKRSTASIADPTCSQIVQEIIESNHYQAKSDFYKQLDSTTRPNSASSYKHILDQLEKTKLDEKLNIIKSNLDALLFIDYMSSIDELIKLNRQILKLEESPIHLLYDWGFDNYKKAIELISNEKPAYDINLIQKLHIILMAKNVGNIKETENIGNFRKDVLFGNIQSSRAITEKQYNELSNNLYLSTNFLGESKNGRYLGTYSYLPTDNLKPVLKERLKIIAPDLLKKIQRYNVDETGNIKELRSALIVTLVEDLLSWFVKQKDDLGEINSPLKFRQFIHIVATFQKSFISIHPFPDGNGRISRLLAFYYPFIEKGLPPPRFLDTDGDLYTSIEEWEELIIKGCRNTQNLYESMSFRLKNGLPIESTPELLLPIISENLKISLKVQKPFNVVKENREITVDSQEIAEYFIIRFKDDPKILDRFAHAPSEVYDELIRDFEKYFLKSNIDYNHEKKGLENLSLHFADIDFKTKFADRSFSNKKKWNFKMNRWYQDEIVWRGLSRRYEEISEKEILRMFTSLNSQFVSNRILGQLHTLRTQDDIKKMAIVDFEHFNYDLAINGGIERMAKDHSESGPLYSTSYGYSTSKKREVGKAFAMGAMVVAPYGKHQKFQHLLKSRVLVGMKRANKDVDLSRLKQLRPDFSYKYPRQQEVMGIGAADPDSIMLVQLIDEKGDVIKSYVRNPNEPSQVLVFEKEMSDLENLTDNYSEKFELNDFN